MKTTKSTQTNPIRRLLSLAAVVSCLGFAACSNLAGTADREAVKPFRVASYIDQSGARSNNEPADAALGLGYEWFY
jgi:hypothetical protein